MVKRRRKAVANLQMLAAVGMLLLAACAKPDMGFGKYVLRNGEVTATYRVPAPLNDALVQEVEQLRVRLRGKAPAYYIIVSVDNRRGRNEFLAGEIDVFNRKDERVVSEPVAAAIKNWADAAHLPQAEFSAIFLGADKRPEFSGVVPGGKNTTVALLLWRDISSIGKIVFRGGGAKQIDLKRL